MKIPQLVTFLFFSFATLLFAANPEPAPNPDKIKDKVSITLGQKLFVEIKRQGDVLTDPKIVEKPEASSLILGLEFRKETDMLVLVLKNPFPKALTLRALARLKGHKDYFETSMLPILAGLSNYESWQDPIEELILFDFKLSDEKL